MTLDQARAELKSRQARMSAFAHATALIYYDGVTAAPKGTAENRAQTLAVLSEESYRLSTDEKFIETLEFLDENSSELSEAERRQVYLLLKDIRAMRKIPMEEFVAYQRLLAEADAVWHEAKEKSDFPLFEPLLGQIFDTNVRFAGYIAPEKKPYDHWLGEYEDGLTMEKCDGFFAAVRSRLVPLIEKAAAAKPVDESVINGCFPTAKQEELSTWLMKTIGLDLDHVGITTTEHPFTTSFGSHFDERITTHYHEEDFSMSMFSVIHEGGHALYDTGSADELAYTVLDGGVSMGVHESQSRFYENILGRSRGFCELAFPKLVELFPQLSKYTAEDFYRAVNRVRPSLIRTEADEVTYCLHVMIRYEIEKRVMAGELAVHDLPGEWNRLYKEYLGVDVPDDRQGVLQDSHWSGGMIGYFPSYALGSAYGAQFLAKMRESVDVDGCLRRGDFAPINAWNRENIWRHGSLYAPDKLLERVFGAPFDPKYYLDYLESKVKDVYGV
ncbi:MAG: carboxypeptidase M32 [Oscillospiraceae bacterium]|nr:carboxypeptidase M32 [Oscillospiraceae bacterium]